MNVTGPPPLSIDEVLRTRFHLDSFRPWQREAIEGVLGDPGRVLVVAPTGGGKSLTYQLPAAMLEGTTLVLSPLVALMEDQVRGLRERGIEATYLASTLDLDERRQREADVARGRYKIVYAAPERLGSDAFLALLERSRIELVAVDEAHCISQWGHDFRPDYRRIGALLARLRPPRILACTATATPDVRQEIRAQLGFDDGPCREVLRGFARPNLHLAARTIDGPREARRALADLFATALGAPDKPRGAAIVYAATRRATEQWTATLREQGWSAQHYHAGMDGDARSKVAHAFASQSLDVIVATNAFGMGIDRPDIRAVVHVQPPGSIEAYYQEVGRAGRDGADAHGLLLCSGSDIALRRRLSQLGGDGAAADPVLAARAWKLFRELLRYLDARTCRHDFVLRYFGDEKEVLGGCGHCDVCESIDDLAADGAPSPETAVLVRKALAGVARAQRRAGLQAIADMLRGVDGERTRRFGFTQLSTFGILSDREHDWIVALLRALLAAGWIDLTATEHPVPFLTKAGGEVMRSAEPVRFALPSPAPSRGRGRARDTRGAAPAPRRDRDDAGKIKASLDDEARSLFERLRARRAEIARARSVPAYVVAFDRTLVELATHKPRTRAALAEIYGFGPNRIEQYGDSFLEVLTEK